MQADTLLIIDSSENNADLYYKTRFFIPDPAIYVENKGRKILVLNDLEVDRGKKEARVDLVLSLSEYRKILPTKKRKKAGLTDIVDIVFKELKVRTVLVPGRFPIKYADALRKLGYRIDYKKEEPFFEERLRKTPEEVKLIKESLKKTASAMDLAVKMIASSAIKKDKLFLDGAALTSEKIKGEINAKLSRLGFSSEHTIVACGMHSSMPHHSGEGPLLAGQPIVIDIFPRSQKNGYFGDMTRTVVKGEPAAELEKMYRTVLRGQKLAIGMIKDGVSSNKVHGAVVEFFRKSGFDTLTENGKREGFIHSTGHGLGLEIHEPPRVGPGDEVLKAGNVVTVEPGLYYERLGGIRIEDVVAVTKKGCVNLTRCPKKFRV